MGKWNNVAKLLGEKTIKNADDANEILKLVDNPELAVSLTGQPRANYLKALDIAQGPRDIRAKNMGFGDETLFHGTEHKDSAIDAFRESGTKRGDVAKYGKGVYLTPWPEYADQYAGHGEGAIYPVKIKNKTGFHPADQDAAKDIIQKAGYELPQPRRLRSTEEGLHLLELAAKKEGRNISDILDKGNVRIQLPDDGITVAKPNEIRSVNAAFDKRFANSPLLLAGAGAVPKTEMSPLPYLREIANLYESAKKKVTDPLADQLNITKDPKHTQEISSVLATVADPVNLVPGAAGVGLGVLQMTGDPNEDLPPPKKYKYIEQLFTGPK